MKRTCELMSQKWFKIATAKKSLAQRWFKVWKYNENSMVISRRTSQKKEKKAFRLNI